MANALDLQEQEQLDDLKAFWKRWGNAITWAVTLVLLAFAGWNGWNWYQRDQAAKAMAMFDALDAAVQAGDADRASRVFGDLKERFPRTIYAQQGGLLAARVQSDKGQAEAAKATLTWLADNAGEDEYRAVARLRLAGLQLQAKQPADALKTLEGATAPAYVALVADRRGDALMAQGKKEEAKAAYQAAYQAMDSKIDYRRLIEAKLTALGAAPAQPAAEAASGAAR